MLCSGVNAALGPPISVCTHPGLNISTLIPFGSTSFARIDIAMFNAALLDLYWYADPNPIVLLNVCSEPIPVLIATICFRLLAATLFDERLGNAHCSQNVCVKRFAPTGKIQLTKFVSVARKDGRIQNEQIHGHAVQCLREMLYGVIAGHVEPLQGHAFTFC